jgi:hypothetical protein
MAKRMFVVTYDIPATTNSETRKAISEAIQASGVSWWHHLRFTWLVVTDKGANEVARPIMPLVQEAKGVLLVMEVVPSKRQGWMTPRGWKWIQKWTERLSKQSD